MGKSTHLDRFLHLRVITFNGLRTRLTPFASDQTWSASLYIVVISKNDSCHYDMFSCPFIYFPFSLAKYRIETFPIDKFIIMISLFQLQVVYTFDIHYPWEHGLPNTTTTVDGTRSES